VKEGGKERRERRAAWGWDIQKLLYHFKHWNDICNKVITKDNTTSEPL